MDSDSLNRSLEGLRRKIDDWLLMGSTSGSRNRKKLIGKVIKAVLYPFIIGVIIFSVAISKLGVELGIQSEAPQELLGTAGNANKKVEVDLGMSDNLDLSSIEIPEDLSGGSEPAGLPDRSAMDSADASTNSVVEVSPTANPTMTSATVTSATVTPTNPVEEQDLNAPLVDSKLVESDVVEAQPVNDTGAALPSESEVVEDGTANEEVAVMDEFSQAGLEETVVDSIENKRVLILPVLFAVGSARITQDTIADDTKVKELFDSCPGNINLVGHSDSLGLEDSNISLGLARAEAVREIILRNEAKYQVRAERLKISSRGSSEPIRDNSTEQGRAANRRVEVTCESSV